MELHRFNDFNTGHAMPTNRRLFVLYFLGCAALMGIALYFQYGMGLEPCPLCMLQRGAVIAVGVVGLVAALHNPRGWGGRLYGIFLLLFAGTGAGLAIRQLWLQHLPADQVPACLPSFDYMIQAFPLVKALSLALRGSGDCAQVTWRFLGLSMPGWTLVAFVGMALLALYVVLRPKASALAGRI